MADRQVQQAQQALRDAQERARRELQAQQARAAAELRSAQDGARRKLAASVQAQRSGRYGQTIASQKGVLASVKRDEAMARRKKK